MNLSKYGIREIIKTQLLLTSLGLFIKFLAKEKILLAYGNLAILYFYIRPIVLRPNLSGGLPLAKA